MKLKASIKELKTVVEESTRGKLDLCIASGKGRFGGGKHNNVVRSSEERNWTRQVELIEQNLAD